MQSTVEEIDALRYNRSPIGDTAGVPAALASASITVPGAAPSVGGGKFAAGPYASIEIGSNAFDPNSASLGAASVTLLNTYKVTGAFEIVAGSSGFELYADGTSSIVIPGATDLFGGHTTGFLQINSDGLLVL